MSTITDESGRKSVEARTPVETLYPCGREIDASLILSWDLGPVLEPGRLSPTVPTRERGERGMKADCSVTGSRVHWPFGGTSL